MGSFKLAKKSAPAHADDLSSAVNSWQAHSFATATPRATPSSANGPKLNKNRRGIVSYLDEDDVPETRVAPKKTPKPIDPVSRAMQGYKGYALSA